MLGGKLMFTQSIWTASPTILLLADAALTAAKENDVPLAWKLEVVQDVGHSNGHMASHAVNYLFSG
jgi:hypothetical protein